MNKISNLKAVIDTLRLYDYVAIYKNEREIEYGKYLTSNIEKMAFMYINRYGDITTLFGDEFEKVVKLQNEEEYNNLLSSQQEYKLPKKPRKRDLIHYDPIIPEIELKFKSGRVSNTKICSADDAYSVLMNFFDQDSIALTESFLVLFLNRANWCIGWIKHSQGGMGETVVDIKLILGTALKCAASGIIIAHNHPSGNIEPSIQDVKVTQKIKDSCRLLDITLLDHLIVGDFPRKYYSFKESQWQ